MKERTPVAINIVLRLWVFSVDLIDPLDNSFTLLVVGLDVGLGVGLFVKTVMVGVNDGSDV